MIFQPSHIHHTESPKKQLREQPDEKKMLQVLYQFREKTQDILMPQTVNKIQQMRKFHEQKVYLSFSSSAQDYLSHLLERNQEQTKDHVAELLNQKKQQFVKAIDNNKYDVKIRPGNIKQIRDQLIGKISQIKGGIQNISQLQQRKQKQQQLYQNYLEFRKKGYWNQKSQKSQQVKQFLKKMYHAKQKMKKKIQQDIKKRQQQIKKSIEKQKQLHQKNIKQHVAKSIEKQTILKKQRYKKLQQHNNKQLQANKFLIKYKSQKPLYIIKQQKFQKQVLQAGQIEIKKKLADLKKNKKGINSQQIQQHIRKYQQYKQKLIQKQLKKQQQQKYLYQKNQNQLKQLFHSHFHQVIIQQEKSPHNLQSQKKKKRIKILEYSGSVLENHMPKIDPKKKQEIQNTIKQLQLQQDKNKRKKLNSDGTVIYQDKNLLDPKEIGKAYLINLKKQNQGKKRKNPQEQRSSSMMELTKKPKLDYLRQGRQKRLKSTLSNWKKVLEKNDLSSKDKFESVMGQVSVLEQQARQKQVQLRNMKNKSKAIELKQQLDKYYLESVAAKMIVLKDVILKQ